VIGGISEAAVRRAVRFGAGMHLMRSSADEVRKVKQRIANECERSGKNPMDIEITMVAPATLEQLQELDEIGVDRVFLSVWDGDLNAFSDRIEEYQSNVLTGLAT
jgi:alkanesulfonate monooxygenase SsuD/methylene tetrahydromethanopterin reductase-like flavin-dependent oxidoreductase (luciferase family)